jgi:hypothetical protein
MYRLETLDGSIVVAAPAAGTAVVVVRPRSK